MSSPSLSYRRQFFAALMSLLIVVILAVLGLNIYHQRRRLETDARAVARQTTLRLESSLHELAVEARSQMAALHQSSTAGLGLDESVELIDVLRLGAPAFVSRPLMSFAGVARASDGEYAMLETLPDGGVRLVHYDVQTDGTHETRSYSVDALNRLHLTETTPWNGYDPRERPFYRLAAEAPGPVWTDSYDFFVRGDRPSVLGVSLAQAVRDREGKVVGVVDVDFNVEALSTVLRREAQLFGSRVWLVEKQRSGKRQVIASTDFSLRRTTNDRDPSDDPTATAMIHLLEAARPPEVAQLGEQRHWVRAETLGEELPPWELVVAVPETVLASDNAEVDRVLYPAIVSLLAFGALLAWSLARLITRPLARLAEEVSRQETGLAGVLTEEGPTEVRVLVQRLNDLAGRVRSRQAELAAAEEHARERAGQLHRLNELLVEVTRALTDSAIDDTEFFQLVTRSCTELLGLTRCAIWRASADYRLLQPQVVFAHEQTDTAIADIEIARYPEYMTAMRRDHRIITHDAETDARTARLYRERFAQAHPLAMLEMGVIVDGQLEGLFTFHRAAPQRPWDDEDGLLARAMAEAVALKFERSARHAAERNVAAQAERAARHAAALAEMANLIRLDRPRDQRLRRLTEIATGAMQSSIATILLRPEGAPFDRVVVLDRYRLAEGTHEAGDVVEERTHPAYFRSLRTRRSRSVFDAAKDPVYGQVYAERWASKGPSAVLDATLRVRGLPSGLVAFREEGRTREWTADEEIFAGAVADLMSLLFETEAREQAEAETGARVSRLSRQNSALAEANELVMSGGDLPALIRRVSELTARAVTLDAATIWLQDHDHAEIRQVNQYVPATGQHSPGMTLPAGSYPRMIARLSGARTLVFAAGAEDPDYADYYRDHLARLGKVSVLHATIRTRDGQSGLIALLRINRDLPWTADEELFAGAMADVLALQLETATRRRVEQESRDRADRLARHEQALSALARSQTLHEGNLSAAFAELTEATARTVGVARVSIWMVQEGAQQLVEMDLYDAGLQGHLHGRELAMATLPRYLSALSADRSLVVSDAVHDPRTAELAETHLVPLGIASLLDAGIFSRDRLIGIVCLEHTPERRNWTVEDELFVGAVSDLAALVLEIAARRTAEEEIERSRERLRLHIQQMPLAAIDWDRQLRIIGWNPAATRMFGFTAEDVIGRDGEFLVSPDDKRLIPVMRRDAALGHSNYVARADNLTHDSRHLLCDWHNTALRDASGRVIGMTSLVEDVTGKVRAEEEIRSLNTSLEQRVTDRTAALAAANEKLKELDRLKSEFLATMSHELRTPLNSIIGFTGIIKQGLAGPVNVEQQKQLEMVHGSARHLLGLINDILDLSRVEAGRLQLDPTHFNPATVVAEAVATLQPMARSKRLELRVAETDETLEVRADRKRFFQVLVNLVSNAVKFTERGTVTVRLRRVGEMARVEVEDTGPGIQSESLPGLFQAFRQVDGSARRIYEGTGLGLYLCRKLVRRLGGEIGVETKWGEGSTFWFWIPVTADELAEVADSHAPFPHR